MCDPLIKKNLEKVASSLAHLPSTPFYGYVRDESGSRSDPEHLNHDDILKRDDLRASVDAVWTDSDQLPRPPGSSITHKALLSSAVR